MESSKQCLFLECGRLESLYKSCLVVVTLMVGVVVLQRCVAVWVQHGCLLIVAGHEE